MYKKSSHGEMTVREKFDKRGAAALTDYELLQTIIGSGVKDNDYKGIAQDVTTVFKRVGFNNLTVDDLMSVKGIGKVKAKMLFSAMELSKRQYKRDFRPIIDSPDEAAKMFDDLKNKKKEHVALITLDGARRVIQKHIISIGTLTSSLVHPREIFSPALEDRAASIIIAHNHPSGMLTISEQDREVTKRIKDVGELMGIPLDDHLIITASGYTTAA